MLVVSSDSIFGYNFPIATELFIGDSVSYRMGIGELGITDL